ncbi:zonadhesin-like [Saccoglossus kowalevskii]|uniref:Zonadhesin-like n=1 Tax=Saccoglossus kowalevskii TaxID=10224 RepID=A0ABM0GIP3_SACKO|nr:PREDICTED: zonadhesin-like [Saccoglossus kowalevskii]
MFCFILNEDAMHRCLIVSCLVILAIACQSNAKPVKRAEGNPHELMVPGQGQDNKCLQCKLSDKMTLAECLLKPESDPDKYEQCTSARPECMSQLLVTNSVFLFISACQQTEACIEESKMEPNFNECSVASFYVTPNCTYCCDNNTITQGYYCPPLRDTLTCTVHGDPRFKTFDGYKYHEGGDCAMYSLMHSASYTINRIDVRITEHKTKDHYRVGSVILLNEDETFELGTNDGVNPVTYLLIPGGMTSPIDDAVLPKYYGTYNQFLLSKHNDTYHVTMDLDLDGYYDIVVKWGIRRVEIDLSRPYSSTISIRGLCGNGNGRLVDEKVTREGTITTSDEEFHRSWGEGNGCGSFQR